MADTTALKNRIRAAIKANDNQEITGPVLQQSLLDIVDELDLNPELENEISARQNGDSTLQQGINTERQARIDADNALGQRITDKINSINASNVTYNHNDSQLDATNVQQAVDEISTKTVFDISAYHATGGTLATYDNLEDALGTNGKNIPQSLRKGGMSVKFVQSSDNKYVQYRLMSDTFNTTVTNWQSIDYVTIISQLNKYIGIVASKGIYSIGENVLTKDDFDLSGYPRIQLSFRYVDQVNGCISFRDINENEIFALYLSDTSATETSTVNIPENFDHAVVVYGAIEITQPIVNVVLTNSTLFNLQDALFTDFVRANNEIQASIIPFNDNGWLNSDGGVINEGNGWNTNFIPVSVGNSFKYNGATQYNTPCIYVMYDINKIVIEYDKTPGTYTDKIVEITNNRVRYIRFSSYNTRPTVQRINEKASLEDKISELEQGKTDIGEIQEILTEDDLVPGYIISGGGVIEGEGGYHTDYVDIINYKRLIIGASSQFATCLGAIYDSNHSFIASIEQYLGIKHSESKKTISETIRISDLKDKYPSARYIRLGAYPTKTHFRCAYYKDDCIDTYITEKLPEQIKSLVGFGNILYGKKYVSCGDSFTAGDFTGYVDKDGKTGTDSDAYDKLTGQWKVYPWWITQRNNMQYLNLAVGGSYMHSGSMGFCDSRYSQIPEDADYITFMFGLNEISVDVGTSTSTDKTTLWGSWNFVLEWVLTNRPNAKVGIIIADAWIDQVMHDNLVAIAKYWGIPYLDLKGNPNVSLQIGGRLNNIQVGQQAITLRNSQYQVSSTNPHPNPVAHKSRSTIVEDFLRSL